ncbi:hypothetical protein F4808DRAFT_444170 [Astrocystis sublimbata]|nr:hypothetical protein F4808DRAFT_444170 [Astrocystis sublimbata]
MADQDMRLRLVVRRHGLPELRLMWHVQLDTNRTISQLLIQLNDQVPLESEHWGLEDYVVELHDTDGTDYECLHYHLVRTVLKPDDRVFIRSLETDDNRRRRISGRLQISSDGRHLVDGVPFGRPSLRAPAGRPAIHIPPPKRARLTYSQPSYSHHHRHPDSESDSSPVLRLTHGESRPDQPTPPRSATRFAGGLHDADTDTDDEDDDDYHGGDDSSDGHDLDSDSGNSEMNQSEAESDDASESEGGNDTVIRTAVDTDGETDEEPEDESEGGDDETIVRTAVDTHDETSDENGEQDYSDHQDEEPQPEPMQAACDRVIANSGRELSHFRADNISLETLDKLTILNAAFPQCFINMTYDVLMAAGGNLSRVFDILSESFDQRLSRKAVLAWKPGVKRLHGIGSDQAQLLTKPAAAAVRETGGSSSSKKRKFQEPPAAEQPEDPGRGEPLPADEDELDHLRLRYDRAGFPPGTITSGTGLTHMAAVSASFNSNRTNGNSEATSTTLKASTDEPMDQDDEASSSGTSSAASDASSEEDSSDEDNASSSGDEDDDDPSDGNSSSSSDRSGSDPSDSESSDDSDADGARSIGDVLPSPSSPASDSDSSDEDSDSGPEEYSVQRFTSSPADDKDRSDSSDSSDESDSQSSSSDSSSESEEEEAEADDKSHQVEPPKSSVPPTPQRLPEPPPVHIPLTASAAPKPVPPGAGKTATKVRNARRRAAKARRALETAGDATTKDTPTAEVPALMDEAARFAAKRKELLDAIANGGIELGAPRKSNHSPSITQRPEPSNHEEAPRDESEVSGTESKRRRLDRNAGRRMILGSLGLGNPKTKEDEAKLREKIQAEFEAGSQSSKSRQAEPPAPSTTSCPVNAAKEEDILAWRSKINYRAVECCYDNIELVEPPFPFQQRWDPQQQFTSFFKGNKRGGKGKKSQRNHAGYYNDDSQVGQKRKRNEVDGSGFDKHHAGERDSDNIMLNYDDVIPDSHDDKGQDDTQGTNPANATDLDDLPSLPQDITTLPVLHPGEVQVGMVITWQKWSCSSATKWQPQLSRVSAIVAAVDDDAATLEVCLAKRDRYLDGNEKKYDEVTGQRIYGKFEAPDLLEEEGVDDNDDNDEGYRDMPWAEMQDPRILQQPLDPTVELGPSSNCLVSIETDENSIGIEDRAKPTTSIASGHLDPTPSAAPVSTTDGDIVDNVSAAGVSPEGRLSGQPSARQSDASAAPNVMDPSNATSHQAGQYQQTTDWAMSDVSQISSPSRQLHETTSQALDSHSPIHTWVQEQIESSQSHITSPMPLPTIISSQPHLGDEVDSGLTTGTPDMVLPLPHVAVPSSTSSVYSGRQLDYAMDIDDNSLSVPFAATDEIEHRGSSRERNSAPSEHRSPTPVPIQQTPTPTPGNSKTTAEYTRARLSPSVIPNSQLPSSASSLFCTAQTSHSQNMQSPGQAAISSSLPVSMSASKPMSTPMSLSRYKSKSKSKSNTPAPAPDADPTSSIQSNQSKYEEAMRRLDEQFDDDLIFEYSTPVAPSSSMNLSRSQSQTGSQAMMIKKEKDSSVLVKQEKDLRDKMDETLDQFDNLFDESDTTDDMLFVPRTRTRKTRAPQLESISLPPPRRGRGLDAGQGTEVSESGSEWGSKPPPSTQPQPRSRPLQWQPVSTSTSFPAHNNRNTKGSTSRRTASTPNPSTISSSAPPPSALNVNTRSSRRFTTIPAGSQVVELSSDPPSSDVEEPDDLRDEDYADDTQPVPSSPRRQPDSDQGRDQGSSSLPKGEGWVQKQKKMKKKKGTQAQWAGTRGRWDV